MAAAAALQLCWSAKPRLRCRAPVRTALLLRAVSGALQRRCTLLMREWQTQPALVSVQRSRRRGEQRHLILVKAARSCLIQPAGIAWPCPASMSHSALMRCDMRGTAVAARGVEASGSCMYCCITQQVACIVGDASICMILPCECFICSIYRELRALCCPAAAADYVKASYRVKNWHSAARPSTRVRKHCGCKRSLGRHALRYLMPHRLATAHQVPSTLGCHAGIKP